MQIKQECRSIQLLRYFNETSRKACGRCDVCVSHSDRVMGNKAYGDISRNLMKLLRDKPLSVAEAMSACQGHEEEEVVEAIRWMIDEGVLRKDDNEVLWMA